VFSCIPWWQFVHDGIAAQRIASNNFEQCFDAVCWQQEVLPACKKLSGGVIVCMEQSADLRMAQLMPLPLTVSCFSEIQIGFTCTSSPG